MREHMLPVRVINTKTLSAKATNQRFLYHVLLHVTTQRFPVLEAFVAVITSEKFVGIPLRVHVVDVLIQVIASNEAFLANAALIPALMLIEVVFDLEGLFALLASVSLRV